MTDQNRTKGSTTARNRSRRGDGRRGQSVVELGVAAPFLILFALGGFAIGMMFDRHQTVIQVGRNAGGMFSRGVDFNNLVSQQVLLKSASGLNMQTSGGEGVIYLSLVEKVPMGQSYNNEGLAVFLQRHDIGNPAKGASPLGTPPVNSDGTIAVDPFNDSAAIASIPSALLAVMRDSDRIFISEVIYEPKELAFAPFVDVDTIYTRSYF